MLQINCNQDNIMLKVLSLFHLILFFRFKLGEILYLASILKNGHYGCCQPNDGKQNSRLP